MKTLVLVACLLTVSLAADPAEVKRFDENYRKCLEQTKEPLAEKKKIEAIICLVHKYNLVDAQDVLILEKQNELADKVISDPAKLSQVKEIISKCDNEGYQGPGSNQEKFRRTVICAQNVMEFVDKP